MKLKYLAILIAVISFLSCEDEQPVYEARYLLPGQWQLTGWYDDEEKDLDNDGTASIDLYSQWDGCSKQSIINFRTNNDFEFTTHGNPDNPGCTTINVNDVNVTRWQLLNENTVLLTGDNFSRQYEIITLEDELLVIRGADLLVNTNDTPSNYTGGYLRFARYSDMGNR